MQFKRLSAMRFVFFALLVCLPLLAQRDDQLDIPRSSDPGKQPFIRQFVADEIVMWTSPFRKSSYESRGFKRYVIPFALITGALIATDHQTSNLLPNTEDQSTWSLRVSQIGAPYTLAGISAGMYLISRATGDKKARETGFVGALAIAHSQLITFGLKSISQRERPLDYKENNHGGIAFFRGGDSFPSGHSSSSFALATVFAYEYGRDHKWVPYVPTASHRPSLPPGLVHRSTGCPTSLSAARWASWWDATFTRPITIPASMGWFRAGRSG